MKRILQNKAYQFLACIIAAIILMLVLGSCRDYEKTDKLTYIEGVVLNRRVNHKVLTLDPFESVTQYQLYIYNGTDSKWYETTDSLYKTLRPRDSISSYVITTIFVKKE